MNDNNSSNPHDQVAKVAGEVSQQRSRRRAFLKTAAGAAGGLALGLQLVAKGDEAATTAPTELLVDVPGAVLSKVGGFGVIETETDKIIVVRTGEATLSACSAVCTHKGCTVDYDAGAKQLACPCHGARFDLDGKVVQGPAKRNLKAYNARIALGLKQKA